MAKRNDITLTCCFPSTSLHLDEVERVAEMMEEAYGVSPSFKDAELVFEDLPEVVKLRGTTPAQLQLSVSNFQRMPGNCAVHFGGELVGAWIYYTGPQNASGLFYALRDYAKARQWWVPLVFTRAVAVIAAMAGSLLFVTGCAGSGLLAAASCLAGGALFITLPVRFLLEDGWFFRPLILVRTHEDLGFVARNRDRLVFLVLGAVVSILLTAPLTYLVLKLLGKLGG